MHRAGPHKPPLTIQTLPLVREGEGQQERAQSLLRSTQGRESAFGRRRRADGDLAGRVWRGRGEEHTPTPAWPRGCAVSGEAPNLSEFPLPHCRSGQQKRCPSGGLVGELSHLCLGQQ